MLPFQRLGTNFLSKNMSTQIVCPKTFGLSVYGDYYLNSVSLTIRSSGLEMTIASLLAIVPILVDCFRNT